MTSGDKRVVPHINLPKTYDTKEGTTTLAS